MKYKNKNGISLNYTSDDIHTRLVKEVILEAIDILDEGRHYDCKEFLKENFDIVEVEDFIGDTENVQNRQIRSLYTKTNDNGS